MTCPSCQRLNRDDARFCDACGSALGAPPPLGESPDRARGYTPRHLAEKILRSRAAIEGERKLVTVLFADVKGSMELAEQVDPEEWHRILDRFFQILAEGVHRFEGTVNQYTGDGIMALFGAPIAHEDHAQRACHAALALSGDLRAYAQELRRELGLTFSVRMGINTGPVVVGKIGDDMRMDYTAQGHTVGLAARMEQLAEPGLAYLSADTARRVEGYFDLEDLGEFKVKGSKEPVHAFALRGAGALRTRLDVSRARGFSMFVGRDEELARLEGEAEQALAGDGRALGVVAQAGTGKSRLCREFAERCRARGTRVLEAQAVAHGRNLPLLPVLQILRGLCGVDETDSDQAVREKVAGRVILLDETLRDSLPLLFDLLGVPDPAHALPDLDPAVRRHQVLSLITTLARASAREHGLVLLIEDLHWVDVATEAVLGALAAAAVDHRILLLVNFRPGYEAAWLKAPNYTELGLVPLGADAMDALTEHLLGRDASLEPLLPLIRERAGGNPFFVEEIVRTLATTGELEGVRGAHRLSAPITTLTVPESLQDLLAARVDQLDEAEKIVIQAAAVVGRTFPAALLGQITSLRDEDIRSVLTTLRDAEFIYEQALHPESRFAFTHALTQEVAYASQLRDRRLATHAQIGRVLQDVEPERQDERAALIAHHLEEAGEGAAAAPWRGRAARRASRANPDAARGHYRRVLELIEDEPEDEASAELLVDASINVLLLSFVAGVSAGEAMSVYYRGRAVAEAHGWDQAVSGLLAVYGLVTGTSTGDVDAYRRNAAEAFDIAQRTGEDGIVLVSGLTLCTALTLARDFREAERVVAISQRAGESFGLHHPGQGAMVLHIEAAAAQIQSMRGQPNEAVDRLCELLPVARESGDLVVEMLIRLRRSIAGQQVSHLPYLPEDARRVAELAERTAAPFVQTNALLLTGILHRDRGEHAEALRCFERTLELIEESRTSVWDQPFQLGWVALCESSLGHHERAHASAVGAFERGRQMGSAKDWALYCLASVLLDQGDPASADEIRSAIDGYSDKIEECGYTSARPFVPEFRARLADLCNDRDTARREWARAETQWRALGAPTKAANAAELAR